MKWIRSPFFDCFLILSGLPIGLFLLALPPSALLTFFAATVLLETGHSLSPIMLAWSHPGFRRRMLTRPWKYIALPAVVFSVTLAIGAATSLGWTSYVNAPHQMFRVTDMMNPFPVVVWIYWTWNIYHFGMQWFGMVCLYRRDRPISLNQRLDCKIICLGLTAFGMGVLPAITNSSTVMLVGMGVFSASHWLQEIGLCAVVSRRSWLFTAAALLMGVVGFAWMVPTPTGNFIRVIPVVISARMGLGFAHFLYDRWLWKIGDPEVRAIIGSSLFPATSYNAITAKRRALA